LYQGRVDINSPLRCDIARSNLLFVLKNVLSFTGTNTLQKAQQSSFYGSNDPQIVSKLNAVFIKSCALKEQLEKRLGVKLSNNQELATKPQII